MKDLFNGMLRKIEPGLCRLSSDGCIAVKVGNDSYKSYNLKTGRLTNCDGFVFDVGEEMFFVVPTNHVSVGDIILVGGNPKCVREISDDGEEITVINYKDSTVEHILPERHIFMGNTYLYGKIVSLFGDMFSGGKKNKNGISNIMKYAVMSEVLKGFGNNSSSISGGFNLNSILPFMFFSNSGNNFFDGLLGDSFSIFDDGEDDEVKSVKKSNSSKKKVTSDK